MKRLALGLLGGLAMVGCAVAEPAEFHAGIARLQVQDEPAFTSFVWYPTKEAETAWRAGEMNVEATRNAAIAGDRAFPVVLLSHGSGGSPFGHRELAAHLARDGYIVVTPMQIGDSVGRTEGREAGRSLIDRPRQAVKALDAVLADPRFAAHADAARIGMVGFSAGGYTTLVLAGAKPDFV